MTHTEKGYMWVLLYNCTLETQKGFYCIILYLSYTKMYVPFLRCLSSLFAV